MFFFNKLSHENCLFRLNSTPKHINCTPQRANRPNPKSLWCEQLEIFMARAKRTMYPGVHDDDLVLRPYDLSQNPHHLTLVAIALPIPQP